MSKSRHQPAKSSTPIFDQLARETHFKMRRRALRPDHPVRTKVREGIDSLPTVTPEESTAGESDDSQAA